MQYLYYVGDGPEAAALHADIHEKRQQSQAARQALMNEYACDGLMENQGKIIGITFTQESKEPWLKFSKKFKNGFGYKPDLRYKKGKELKKALANPLLFFQASKIILDKLNMHHMAVGAHMAGLALYHAVAGTAPGKRILVKMPVNNEETPPVAPDWLKNVKESEFLAAQGN